MIEAIFFILLIVILAVIRNSHAQQQQTLKELQEQVNKLLNETRLLKEKTGAVTEAKQEAWKPPARPVDMPPPVRPAPRPEQPAEFLSKKPERTERVREKAPVEVETETPANMLQGWLARNPDMEKFIGENLVNKIGITVLVLGIAFFVKYAIDQQWINEYGRVAIGLFCGVLLVGLAHYLRKGYRSFSSVLAGGGLAVFYFTIAFAFHQYHMFTAGIAFGIMVMITGFAVLLSLLYDKIELAVIATVGGFITPFLLSTGQGNYIVLFSYLIVLNAGLLSLAYFKRWALLNWLALGFTELIFGGWLVKTLLEEDPKVSFPLALLFATLLYLLFLGMNMVYQLRHKLAFRPQEISILLLLNASYFAAGMLMLARVDNGVWQGTFTVAAGAVNLALALFFFKRQTDRNLLYLLIGLTLSFLSLAIPVQLNGHAITLFWCAEFVLLFWLFRQSGIRLFHQASLLIAGLAIISLLMDWEQCATFSNEGLTLIYDDLSGFVTNIVAIAAFGFYAVLLQNYGGELPAPVGRVALRRIAWGTSVVIAYLSFFFSVNLVFRDHTAYDVANIYHRLVTGLFVSAAFLYLSYRKKNKQFILATGITGIWLLYHLLSFATIESMRNGVLEGRYSQLHLPAHWFSCAALMAACYFVLRMLRNQFIPAATAQKIAWTSSLLLLLFFSQEMRHLFIALGYRPGSIVYLERQFNEAALTIVWAVFSFGLMWVGMRYKQRTLRVISLSVFCMALLKLFLFDLADMSPAGKILAFILLGILLLTISFMYQKLKKMIIDDAAE